MTNRALLLACIAVLAAAWLGPLPARAHQSFAAHMALHLILIALAAPLLALGLSGTRVDDRLAATGVLNPVPMSLAELVVVWAWHVPLLHGLARGSSSMFAVEQLSFLIVGAAFWLSVFSHAGDKMRRAGIGVIALLLTSMHMTLLGALLCLAQRPLYAHAGHHPAAVALEDQQLGGALMLAVGGTVYLVAALWLLARVLGHPAAPSLDANSRTR